MILDIYLKRLLGIHDKPNLIVYRSFSNKDSLTIIGRVVESIEKSTSSSLLGNALSLLRNYLAKPYNNIEVTIISDSSITKAITNVNGIFEVVVPLTNNIRVKLGEKILSVEIAASSNNAAYGIISDIDDTILISNSARTLKLLYLLFTKNAHSRKPFPGVAEFYQALVENNNPIFYVSSSAWNIYNLLIEFMEINHIPKGPLLLKEVGGVRSIFKTAGKHGHKSERIKMILEKYPHLPFILIGDSGQRDAEIYSLIAKEYPDRIKVIYIRDVTLNENEIVKKAINTLENKVELVLVKTSKEAADHALQKGYITKREKENIKAGVVMEQ
ncbi:MAG: phosphatase domain-containing protein [Patescibacteria group bacterium]